jgi:hypothetical protein
MGGGKLLERFHVPELRHRSFSSSEQLVAPNSLALATPRRTANDLRLSHHPRPRRLSRSGGKDRENGPHAHVGLRMLAVQKKSSAFGRAIGTAKAASACTRNWSRIAA